MPRRPWFAPKVLGYGAGWPIAWQGWAVLAGFILGMALSGALLRGLELAVAWAVLIGGFVFICARTTDGGWRWRP